MSGIVIMSVSSPKVKKVLNLDIYMTIAAFALLGLIWIWVILDLETPETVTFPEAFFTVSMFMAMTIILFIIDKHREIKMPQYYDRIISHQESKLQNPYTFH